MDWLVKIVMLFPEVATKPEAIMAYVVVVAFVVAGAAYNSYLGYHIKVLEGLPRTERSGYVNAKMRLVPHLGEAMSADDYIRYRRMTLGFVVSLAIVVVLSVLAGLAITLNRADPGRVTIDVSPANESPAKSAKGALPFECLLVSCAHAQGIEVAEPIVEEALPEDEGYSNLLWLSYSAKIAADGTLELKGSSPYHRIAASTMAPMVGDEKWRIDYPEFAIKALNTTDDPVMFDAVGLTLESFVPNDEKLMFVDTVSWVNEEEPLTLIEFTDASVANPSAQIDLMDADECRMENLDILESEAAYLDWLRKIEERAPWENPKLTKKVTFDDFVGTTSIVPFQGRMKEREYCVRVVVEHGPPASRSIQAFLGVLEAPDGIGAEVPATGYFNVSFDEQVGTEQLRVGLSRVIQPDSTDHIRIRVHFNRNGRYLGVLRFYDIAHTVLKTQKVAIDYWAPADGWVSRF